MAIQLAVNLSSPLFLPTKFPFKGSRIDNTTIMIETSGACLYKRALDNTFKGHPKLDHSTIDTTISSAKEA